MKTHSKKHAQKVFEISQFLISREHSVDRYGNLVARSGKSRWKFTSVALRHEVKTDAGWKRVSSGYLKDIEIKPSEKDGVLRIHGTKLGGC